MRNARPRSFLDEFDKEEDLRDGIVVEGFEYEEPNRYDEDFVPVVTWADIQELNPIKVSNIFENLADARMLLSDELDAADMHKVAGFTRGLPIIYFVRPDNLSSESGYVITWIDE